MAGALRQAWAERQLYDRRTWLIVAGSAAVTFGRGVMLPFATLYFYNVRGFPLATIGLALAIALPVAALAGLAWGALADRIGRKRVILGGFAGAAASAVGMAFVRTPSEYFALAVLAGASVAAWSPATRAMVADVTPEERRTRAFGLVYLSHNVGVALGLVAGGLLAVLMPYRALFFVEAAAALAAFAIVALLVRESRPATPSTGARPGWPRLAEIGVPLRDRRFLLFALGGALAGFGWVQFYVTYSPYMKNVIGAPDAWIGPVMGVNTALILLLQVPAAAWAEGRRRTRTYMIAAYLLAWSLLIVWLAGRVGHPAIAIALMAFAIAVMTLGEVIVAPVGNALVASFARGPAEFGRYMAGSELVWTLSSGLGGALGGLFFDRGSPWLLWPVMAALALAALCVYLWLGRILPEGIDHPAAAKAPVPQAEEPPAVAEIGPGVDA